MIGTRTSTLGTLYTDSAYVQGLVSKVLEPALHAIRVWCRRIEAHPDNFQIVKVKSHREVSDARNKLEACQILGSQLADSACKAANSTASAAMDEVLGAVFEDNRTAKTCQNPTC